MIYNIVLSLLSNYENRQIKVIIIDIHIFLKNFTDFTHLWKHFFSDKYLGIEVIGNGSVAKNSSINFKIITVSSVMEIKLVSWKLNYTA
jgi:hypothetical protein